MLSSIRNVWHIGLTGNVFSHQFQGGGVTATIIGPSTKKKNLGVTHLRVTFLPVWVDWARTTDGAGPSGSAGVVEEADVPTDLCEVLALRVGLAESLTLFWAGDLEVLREELALAHLPRESRTASVPD